jgi:hypothetical protein
MGHNGEVPSEFEWIGFLAVQSVKKCVFILSPCDWTSLQQRGDAVQSCDTFDGSLYPWCGRVCEQTVSFFLFVGLAQCAF